jgi:hypothetical protein
MIMRTVAVSKKWVSVVLTLAFAASAAGTKADAESPWALVSLPGGQMSDVPGSDPGTYLACWERETLVVKTREDESDPRSVRVTERILLWDRDTLEYAVHVIGPDESAAPLEIRVLFRRDTRVGDEGEQTWF